MTIARKPTVKINMELVKGTSPSPDSTCSVANLLFRQAHRLTDPSASCCPSPSPRSGEGFREGIDDPCARADSPLGMVVDVENIVLRDGFDAEIVEDAENLRAMVSAMIHDVEQHLPHDQVFVLTL